MTRDEVIERLKRHSPEIRDLGARALFLFGSYARGSAAPGSDVDILVDFATSPTFDAYMDLKFRLEDILGRKVDLVTRGALKPRLKSVIEKEALLVS